MATNTRLYEEVQNNSEALVLAHLGMVKRVALLVLIFVLPKPFHLYLQLVRDGFRLILIYVWGVAHVRQPVLQVR